MQNHHNRKHGWNLWRARWDLNPRSPAPKADTLIRARLRAPLHTSRMEYLHFRICLIWVIFASRLEPLQSIVCLTMRFFPCVNSAYLLFGYSCILGSLPRRSGSSFRYSRGRFRRFRLVPILCRCHRVAQISERTP